jgi:hypothetical protein
MKRVAISALLVALAFGVLASWLGPKMITYWYAPPVGAGVLCTEAVSWAMGKLVWTQLIASAAGAVIGLVVGVLLGRRKAAAPPPTSEPTKAI